MSVTLSEKESRKARNIATKSNILIGETLKEGGNINSNSQCPSAYQLLQTLIGFNSPEVPKFLHKTLWLQEGGRKEVEKIENLNHRKPGYPWQTA